MVLQDPVLATGRSAERAIEVRGRQGKSTRHGIIPSSSLSCMFVHLLEAQMLRCCQVALERLHSATDELARTYK